MLAGHTPAVLRRYDSWFSPALSRRMEFLWFGDRGRPVLVFPTSKGTFHENEDFGLVGALADKVDAGWLQLVCVDSVDSESWYNASVPPALRARRHVDYDRYLHEEMLPFIRRLTGDGNIAAVGASFGAYHAANLAGRYPGEITKAVCFSGLFTVHRFLDGYWDDVCYYNSPAAYIANMDADWSYRLRGVEWVVATGEEDSLIAENRGFADLLARKGAPLEAEFWPGTSGHDWPFWNAAIRNFL
jgi:esterase/lipase superfamily enzyme